MANRRLYTVDQVADLLGLHVKTVRGYVRDGKLRGTRVGKRYLIAAEDLETFTGQPAGPPTDAPHAEASAIVQVDAVGPEAVQRVGGLLGAAMAQPLGRGPLRIETVYDEERARLKIILLGDLERVASVLEVIDLYVREVS